MSKYMTKYNEMKEIFIKEGKEDYFNSIIEETCKQVERQTDYSRDIALSKLIEHELNMSNVIKEWLGIPLVKQDTYRSPTQMIYDEFRCFLDDAAKKYYKNK